MSSTLSRWIDDGYAWPDDGLYHIHVSSLRCVRSFQSRSTVSRDSSADLCDDVL